MGRGHQCVRARVRLSVMLLVASVAAASLCARPCGCARLHPAEHGIPEPVPAEADMLQLSELPARVQRGVGESIAEIEKLIHRVQTNLPQGPTMASGITINRIQSEFSTDQMETERKRLEGVLVLRRSRSTLRSILKRPNAPNAHRTQARKKVKFALSTRRRNCRIS